MSRSPKYLLVGSAPMSGAWWASHRAFFMREGWSIVGVNNAWQVRLPTRSVQLGAASCWQRLLPPCASQFSVPL